MAKINHNNSLDSIDEIFTDAKNKGILFLNTEDDAGGGRHLKIKEKELVNFGTCGYLALEQDERLKEGAIDFTRKFGTQFSVSRAYLSSGTNIILEDMLYEMFGYPVITYSSTSTCHISLIPTLVRERDAIILDQQVHMSVQTAAQLVHPKGIPVEMIRHSNLDMLERKINELGDKYEKIWYMIDGVYSMFGDVPPVRQLIALLNKYRQLHLYVDDAHGMSWYGKNGTGYVFNEAGMHEKMILVSTLAKGFGATGGIAIFPNEELCWKVRIFGGPYCYSHPLSPPVLGAAIASAKIHLSDEIYSMQGELRERINYCNTLLDQSGLPVVSAPFTPIYFIGMGQLKTGHNMISRILQEGFYVNLSLFPAVPVKCTGLRFTITRHTTLDDIKALVDAMAYHFPKALEEERTTENEVRKAFRMPLVEEKKKITPNTVKKVTEYTVQYENTIKNISKTEWDALLGSNGSFDRDGMLFLEDAFSNNPKPEENWDFHYYVIRDQNNKPLLATFFTSAIYKDDIFSYESVSRQIEEKRKSDPYYLTSKTIAMGSLFTLGQHLYIDQSYHEWRKVFSLLLRKISELQEQINANAIVLRDFHAEDLTIKNYLINEGFVKIDMPNNNVIEAMNWKTNDEFLEQQSSRTRRHLRSDVFKYEHFYEIEYKDTVNDEESDYFYQLYLNVKNRNFGINLFDYPKNIVQKISKHPNWEFIILKLKPEYDNRKEKLPVAVIWCHRTRMHYSPLIVGMDYNYLESHKVYKQALFQVVKRAKILGLNKIHLGFSADIEKRKFGAKQIPTVAYLQAKDNFNMEVIESMAV